ncbi:MAG: endonuclease [Cyclobacteriaceae bacterium]
MKNLFLSYLLLSGFLSLSQVPAGYYDGTDGLSGEELKQKLHQIISNHRVRNYSEFRDIILPDLDEDPNNPDNIILFYKNNSIPKTNFASNNQADFWNREHTWPSSHGFSENTDTAYTDVHNLRPSDATVNTSKSNKDFNDIENSAENVQGEAPDTYTNNDFWEPRDEIKGDVARMLFYMTTRYESSRLDLELVDRSSFSGDPELGVLFTLLQWHQADPVSEAERTRHEGAYGYQENRNPFVDHPEWVSAVWSDASEPFIVIDELSFSRDFGTVPFGKSKSQQYNIKAYNLEGDINVSTSLPFQLSTDGSSYSTSIVLSTNNNASQEFAVFIRFEPELEDAATSNGVVVHSGTNLETVSFSVRGKEGEVAITSIEEARDQELGSIAYVTGVVIDAGTNSGNSRVIYDGTAGIVVRSFDTGNESAPLIQGDSVVVSGGLSEYGNLLQIEESPIVLELISQGANLPVPQEITIAEIGEAYESELVIIRNISFTDPGKTFAGGGTAGNFEISDGTGSVVFRVGNSGHPLVGSPVPDGYFDVTGIVGQFFDDYQFSVRDVNDLKFVSGGNSSGGFGEIITIEEARTKSDGQVVTVKGIVIGSVNNNEINRAIYDGTAGLIIRSQDIGNLSSNLKLGDSVLVSGGVLDYNGLFEIEESPITIKVLNSDNSLPDAQEITLDLIGEDYESELISLSEVFIEEKGIFSRGNYTITDGSTDVIFRIGATINPLIGQPIPRSKFDLVGYVGQSNNDYQVFVDFEEDLTILNLVLGQSNTALKLNLISPNPVGPILNLNLESHQLLQSNVKIIDMLGRIVIERTLENHQINVSGLDLGVYLVVVSFGESSVYSRMVKR